MGPGDTVAQRRRRAVGRAIRPVPPPAADDAPPHAVVTGTIERGAQVREGPLSREEREEVLRVHMPEGRITAMPVRRAARLVVLDRVARAFEPGIRYEEAEVNALLRGFSADVSVLRRGLVDEGFMERDRTRYWRCGGTVDV